MDPTGLERWRKEKGRRDRTGVMGNPQETQGLWVPQRAESVEDPRDSIKPVVGGFDKSKYDVCGKVTESSQELHSLCTAYLRGRHFFPM